MRTRSEEVEVGQGGHTWAQTKISLPFPALLGILCVGQSEALENVFAMSDRH